MFGSLTGDSIRAANEMERMALGNARSGYANQKQIPDCALGPVESARERLAAAERTIETETKRVAALRRLIELLEANPEIGELMRLL